LETSQAVQFTRFEKGRWQTVDGTVAEEELVRLHVNGLELARIMCTPRKLDQLALGFLRSEGFIQSMADVRLVNVCPSRTCVEVWLRDASFEPPRQGTITSGCGGGITFADLTAKAKPLDSDLRVTPGQISRLMHSFLAGQQQRGVNPFTAGGEHARFTLQFLSQLLGGKDDVVLIGCDLKLLLQLDQHLREHSPCDQNSGLTHDQCPNKRISTM